MTPTSSTAKRVAAIMHRRPDTKWNEAKEIKPFRKLLPIHDEDLAMVERYYKWHWPPSMGKNILRHDLATLINNWQGEVDRAKIWCEKHPLKQAPRKIIPLPRQTETELTEAEREAAAEEFEKLMGRRPVL